MTLTLVGRIVDRDGLWQRSTVAWDGHRATETRRFDSFPAAEYRSVQPSRIPVNVGHTDRVVGQLVHLEAGPAGDIVGVGTVDGCPWLLSSRSGPWYWSAEFNHQGGRDIEITAVALVENPGFVGLQPIAVHPADVCALGWRSRQSALNPDRLLTRAAATHARRGALSIEPMRIENHTEADHLDERDLSAFRPSGQMMRLPDGELAEVEIRPGRILAVEGRPVR